MCHNADQAGRIRTYAAAWNCESYVAICLLAVKLTLTKVNKMSPSVSCGIVRSFDAIHAESTATYLQEPTVQQHSARFQELESREHRFSGSDDIRLCLSPWH